MADMVEVIILDCVRCGRRKKERMSHALADTAIMKSKPFRGWTAKGVYGAKSTKCPECRN